MRRKKGRAYELLHEGNGKGERKKNRERERENAKENAGVCYDKKRRRNRERRSVSHLSNLVAEKDSDEHGAARRSGEETATMWRLARNESFYSPGMRGGSGGRVVFLAG